MMAAAQSRSVETDLILVAGRLPLLGWFKRRLSPAQARVYQQAIGELKCDSSVVLLMDPSGMSEPVRIEGVPPGRHSVRASIIRYPEGSERVARIATRFRPGDCSERRALGHVAVDSATVVVLDEATFQTHWKEVGTERIGRTSSPSDHRRVAQLIGNQFGLKWREVDFLHSELNEPISEELESRIVAFLASIPEYADYPFLYFQIETSNSWDQVVKAMRDRSWCDLTLESDREAPVFAVTSGFGDGRYEVVGLYDTGELKALEIEFIGPEQDKILEAFPILRY